MASAGPKEDPPLVVGVTARPQRTMKWSHKLFLYVSFSSYRRFSVYFIRIRDILNFKVMESW